MDAIESEVNTKPSSNFIEHFFSKLPVDSRFNKVEFQKFIPITGLDKNTTKIDFLLEKRSAPQCYLISKALIEVNVTLVKKDGVSVPDTTKLVGSINNCLHSLFSTVSMQINDQKITVAQEDYPYRTYVGNLLTFNAESKSSVLESQGWATDTKRSMEITSNAGLLIRSQFWRKDMSSSGAYRPEGCTFLGKFFHDLAGCDKPLPPSTRVYFELTRTKDSFYIKCRGDDTEEYRAIVTACNLYVPVAWMQLDMLNELQIRLPKEPIKYHYRRWTVKQMGIQRNKQDYFSDSLFSESENPVRIFFLIVNSKAYNGDYHLNGFNFARKWTVSAAQGDMDLTAEIETNSIKQQLNQMQQMINTLLNRSQTQSSSTSDNAGVELGQSTSSSGKGPGPNKSSMGSERKSTVDSESKSLFEKLSNLLRRQAKPSAEEADFEVIHDAATEELLSLLRKKIEGQPNLTPSPQPSTSQQQLGDDKTFWLTKCQLELNSQLPGID
jgi:hypothetical protein